MTRLLVILGHKNTADGMLSSTSRLRCAAAATYLQANETAFLLATGAYGTNFNYSPIPHGALLLDEIRTRAGDLTGIEMLGHTTTAFTEEDIYQARRYFADRSCDEIVFVTSEFHGPRVTEMAKLVFRDCSVEIVLARDGSEITESERREELKKLKIFRQGWVDLPLYSKDSVFPDQIYLNAMEQYKHSDSVSLAIVTGALVFVSYPYSKIDFSKAGLDALGLLIVCSLVGVGLFALYLRFAAFAFIARSVIRSLELGWGHSGFSYNHERFFRSRFPHLRFFRSTRVLSFLTLLIATMNFTIAIFLAIN